MTLSETFRIDVYMDFVNTNHGRFLIKAPKQMLISISTFYILIFWSTFSSRPMGSIWFMDPKPPSSFWYMSWLRPPPIAQNRLSKSFWPEPPFPLKPLLTNKKVTKNTKVKKTKKVMNNLILLNWLIDRCVLFCFGCFWYVYMSSEMWLANLIIL